MATDSKEFWNDMWSDMDESYAGHDTVLEEVTKEIKPSRALDLGCGTGGNAMWLAEQGWKVTAVDYSDVAIEKARKNAKERGLNIEFVVADASSYKPEGQYDLITSFYIHLSSDLRPKMFSNAADALAVGGTLLFVSHDVTGSHSGWTDEDLKTLTTPEQVVSELRGLKIEQAYVRKEEAGAHAQGHSHDAEHDAQGHHDSHEAFGVDPDSSFEANSTIVIAIKPK